MLSRIYYSLKYQLLLAGIDVALEFEKILVEDVFGNLKLYSLESGKVVINLYSLIEADISEEEEMDLIDCIVQSLQKSFYDPQFIIYNNRRKRRNEYQKKV